MLTGRQGPREILSGLDITIARGSINTIVGRSGVGKSTLLRLLAGLVAPTAGSLRYQGEEVKRPLDDVVTVFQDYANALLPWRTVAKNVALGLEARGVAKREREERVSEALELVGLTADRHEYPQRLSGGMQQRVQIARAIAVRPRVLLMDEPFGALDNITKSGMQDELLRIRERTGSTIVFITHDVDEAVYLADQALVLDGQPGTIVVSALVDLDGPRDQIATRESPDFFNVRHTLLRGLQGRER